MANLSLCEVFLKRKVGSQAYLVQYSEWICSSPCLHVFKWQKYNQVLTSAPDAQNANLMVSYHWPILNLFSK